VSILTWLQSRFSNGQVQVTATDGAEFWGLAADSFIRQLAFESAENLIANAISKCEFRTFLGGKEVKGDEYYLWNVKPNKNQNSSAFIGKLIHKLYETNEALVIDQNGQLLVVDSFQKTTFALYDYQFTGVTVEDFTFDKTFFMSDVLYFRLRTNDVRRLVNGMVDSFGKMLAYAMKAYQKSKGSKGVLDISAQARGNKDFNDTFEKLMNERFKTFFAADSAVLPLFDGYKYTDTSGSKTYTSETSRDIKSMIDDIFDLTGRGFSIPTVLLTGQITDTEKAIDQLLTLAVDPLCDMIEEEITGKRYGQSAFKSGSKLTIDTRAVKHIDLLAVSSPIDKLISSGGYCVNDIRMLCGDEPINEPWAWQHWMTKNYSTVQELLAALTGGGEKI
jgi:HK97 family phage portal protein